MKKKMTKKKRKNIQWKKPLRFHSLSQYCPSLNSPSTFMVSYYSRTDSAKSKRRGERIKRKQNNPEKREKRKKKKKKKRKKEKEKREKGKRKREKGKRKRKMKRK